MFEISKFKFSKKEFDLSIKVEQALKNGKEIYQNKNDLKKEIVFKVLKDTKPEEIIKLSEEIAKELKDIDNFNLFIEGKIDSNLLLEGILLGLTDIDMYKSTYKKPKVYKVFAKQEVKENYDLAYKKAYSYNVSRVLSHMPYRDVNPDTMVDYVKNIFSDKKFKVTVMREKECKKNKLEGLLRLSSGSMYEPSFIKIEFNNGGEKKLGLVGKGITFDSGGYNLKGGDFTSMKTDMAGSTAVIGTLRRLADLDIKCHVVAYLLFTDNMINEKAMIPGDIITYSNGVSVEIGNTDAEGRLVLADGLIQASNDNCESVIDIATLTGNIVASLGKKYAGLYNTDEKQRELFMSHNSKITDKVWPMPLEEDYNEFIEGNISDIRNIASNKHAGSITAAMFLKKFIRKDIKWTHIDMAAMSRKEEYGTPANGYGVRLLTEFIKEYK